MARVYLIAGLGYGDEGKGTTTDFLTRSSGAHLVVRYNGGAQAGHAVVLPDGRHHKFSQFGSGSFVPGVGTHLSRFMLVNPIFMNSEAKRLFELGLTDIWEGVTVDREALITNPFQVSTNRIREMLRGAGRHGSVGMGIGETMADSLAWPDLALRAGDLKDIELTKKKLRASWAMKNEEFCSLIAESSAMSLELEILWDNSYIDVWAEEYRAWTKKVRLVDRDWLTTQVNGDGVVIFEGAQGALLDENYGFQPHTTWTTCTYKNAQDLLSEHTDARVRVGVLRTYMTRHGHGPFVTEDKSWNRPDVHNIDDPYCGSFRVGYFDVPATHYAMSMLFDSCNQPIDMFAMTHMDIVPSKFCTKYEDYFLKHLPLEESSVGRMERITEVLMRDVRPVYQKIDRMEDFLAYVEAEFGTKIGIFSYGPTYEDKSLHNHNWY